MRATLAILAAALVTACGHAAPRTPPGGGSETAPPADAAIDALIPEPPKDPVARAVEATVVMYEAIAQAAADSAKCADIATRARAQVAAHQTDLAAVRAALHSDRKADVDALMQEAGPRLGPAVVRIDAASARCSSDRALADALAGLSTEEP